MAGIPKTKRSGGPKTETGKAVASQNSLKTGIYSNVVVLPGEDESEYQQLENQFIKDFSPQDIAELTIVRELAVVVWKKHRLERLELSSSLKVLNQRIEDRDYRRHGFFFKPLARFWLDRSEYLTDELLELQDKILEAAEFYSGRELAASDIQSMKLMYPYLFHNIVVQADKLNIFAEETPEVDQLVACMVTVDKEQSVQFVSYAVDQAISLAQDMLWAHENASKFKEATKSIQAQRLLEIMQLEMPRRVNDDLSRIFFRTLTELRKHQQWRQARNTVDVTPKTTQNNDWHCSVGAKMSSCYHKIADSQNGLILI